MSNSEHLKQLGRQTKYSYDKPDPQLLEAFNNQHPENLFLVPFIQDRDEFTSLCPVTGQPDHAAMEIAYVPKQHMVESKSMKLYLMSFRNSGEFHEDVCNRICNDLYELLHPYFIRVVGNFAPRGSLAIRPMIQKWSSELYKPRDMSERIVNEIKFMVESFDRKQL